MRFLVIQVGDGVITCQDFEDGSLNKEFRRAELWSKVPTRGCDHMVLELGGGLSLHVQEDAELRVKGISSGFGSNSP